MAGTCPHCGTVISGNLRQCPDCGGYCLLTQDNCPECGKLLFEPKETKPQQQPDTPEGNEGKALEESRGKKRKKKKRAKWPRILLVLLLLALACAGAYYYYLYMAEQKEEADYHRLEGITNPEFYQQFLIDHPKSKHCDEISQRMQDLLQEVADWNQLQKKVSRTTISQFMQKHPASLRQRELDDMLDSIDWQDALRLGNEEAITDYLHRHPSGRYADDAAARKNALLLSKVTPEEKAMLRGTLESFFSKVIGQQDIEAAKAALPDTMLSFCGKQNADAETVIAYAKDKMASDVIGLHYAFGQKMDVRKETMPDGNTGFAVEVSLQETISRSDASQPSANYYRVNALINQEQKIVKLNIF